MLHTMTMEYGTITGRLVAAVADTPDDPDVNPDIIPITGTVTFTPSVKAILVASESVTVVPAPIVAVLDANGYVSLNGVQSVTVLATTSQYYNPNGWTYRVSFDNLAANGRRVTFDPYNIEVPVGQTIDLSSVTPISGSTGTPIVRGPKGDKGDQGPQGNPGPSDSQVATYFTGPSSTRTAADTRYVARGSNSGNVVLGSDQVHTSPTDTNTGLEVVKSITNPDKTFLGALSGYAVYFGTDQPTGGSIQGGACEAYSLMTGTATHAVLGWEGIGSVAGTGTYPNVIGLASTVQAKDTTTVTSLIGYQARGPLGDATASVANAYSVKVLEPTIGTQRHALHVIGRTTLSLGVHASVLEILGTSAVRRWAVDGGGVFTGYGSDGTSVRTVISTAEEANGKFMSNAFTGTTKHLSFLWQGTEQFAVLAQGYMSFGTGVRQSTVGAAGAAAAPPASPVTYIQVKTAAGTLLAIPAYAAA